MADFSKQWCELNDPEMPHDFDIDSIASTIDPLWYKSYICEGFGFSMIGKKEYSDDVIVYMSDYNNPENSKWVNFDPIQIDRPFLKKENQVLA